MKLTLTNTSTVALPVISEDEGGWADSLEPGQATTLDRSGSDVWIVGDKPGVFDAISEGLQAITAVAKTLITAIAGRKDKALTEALDALSLTIENQGDKPVRVIPGDPNNETRINPGESIDVQGKRYIELRELAG
jgi:hypothetical protein